MHVLSPCHVGPVLRHLNRSNGHCGIPGDQTPAMRTMSITGHPSTRQPVSARPLPTSSTTTSVDSSSAQRCATQMDRCKATTIGT